MVLFCKYCKYCSVLWCKYSKITMIQLQKLQIYKYHKKKRRNWGFNNCTTPVLYFCPKALTFSPTMSLQLSSCITHTQTKIPGISIWLLKRAALKREEKKQAGTEQSRMGRVSLKIIHPVTVRSEWTHKHTHTHISLPQTGKGHYYITTEEFISNNFFKMSLMDIHFLLNHSHIIEFYIFQRKNLLWSIFRHLDTGKQATRIKSDLFLTIKIRLIASFCLFFVKYHLKSSVVRLMLMYLVI